MACITFRCEVLGATLSPNSIPRYDPNTGGWHVVAFASAVVGRGARPDLQFLGDMELALPQD
jgi:hypothetical protein